MPSMSWITSTCPSVPPPAPMPIVGIDMLGINKGFSPRFLRRYADLHTVMTDAVGRYVADVKSQDFPNEQEQY